MASFWRDNWYREWSVGRWTFGIEWVPKANGYALFTLCRESRPDVESEYRRG